MKFVNSFKKDIAKIEGIVCDSVPPTYWTSSGCYALNKILGGTFNKAFGQGRIVGLVGPSGAGKSYLVANAAKQGQEQINAFVLAIDTENAFDDEFVEKIGVDTSEENYLYISVITIEHLKKVVTQFVAQYKKDGETRPVIIIVDSLAMLLTDSELTQLDKGDVKGDQGQRAKQLKALLKGFVQLIKPFNIQMFVTDQVYVATQDAILNGTADGLWVINPAMRYSLSNLVLVTKAKLKEGATGETGAVIGVRMKCEAVKTRFTKPYQKVVIDVPYETGMDKLSGLQEVALELGVIVRRGSYYRIESTQDQFYWKDLNEARVQQILDDAEKITDVSIGATADSIEEDLSAHTEQSITKKRLTNAQKVLEQNPTILSDIDD